MMKVIYLVPSLIKSGPINVVYNIVKNLDRKRFTPIVVALSEYPVKERNNQKWFEALGIEVKAHTYSKWQLQLHTRAIAARLQQELDGPEVIFHAHGYYPTLLLSKMRGIRSMTTMHNRCDEDFRMKKGRLMGIYMSRCYRSALRKLDRCVAICHSMECYYAKDVSSLTTVCNGVQTAQGYYVDLRRETREKYGIAENVKIYMYPAGFSQRKNQQEAVTELKLFHEKGGIVWFAGQGETENACREMAGNDPTFRFLGYQMDMEPFWAAADFMLSPSLSEGMPLAVLDALVRGIPCILSDIPAHRELLESIPGSGLCFPVHESGALRKAVSRAMVMEWDRAAIRRKAVALYSNEAMCRGYEAVYQKLYEGKKK